MDDDLPTVRRGPMRNFPRVAGTCPACHRNNLALGLGGFVTCASLTCPDPIAPSRTLGAL